MNTYNMGKPLCVIVGMGPGISMSTAFKFGENGFQIAMVARNEEKLRSYSSNLENKGIESHSYAGNAGDFNHLRNCLNKVKDELGTPEVVMYNVSVYRESSPTDLSAETAMEDFKANVGGALVTVQAFVEEMKNRGEGKIFLTGGGQGVEPMHLLSSLGIGKAGMRNLCFSLHKELKPSGILVGTVTVNGMVAKGTDYDPDIIAEHFWGLYNADTDKFQREIMVG